jgi:hypothetical protein
MKKTRSKKSRDTVPLMTTSVNILLFLDVFPLTGRFSSKMSEYIVSFAEGRTSLRWRGPRHRQCRVDSKCCSASTPGPCSPLHSIRSTFHNPQQASVRTFFVKLGSSSAVDRDPDPFESRIRILTIYQIFREISEKV